MTLAVRTRGTGSGMFTISAGATSVEFPTVPSDRWLEADVVLAAARGEGTLELAYRGPGSVDLLSLRFNRD